MAMILCGECKQQVSSAADSCPHCGNPLKAKRGIFHYVFWGTVCFFITGVILSLGFFFLTAAGAGFLSASLRQPRITAATKASGIPPAATNGPLATDSKVEPWKKWDVSTSKSPMDDNLTKYATLAAKTTSLPGDSSVLILRKRPKKPMEIFVTSDHSLKRDFDNHGKIVGRIRWGKAEPEDVEFNPSKGDSAAYFPEGMVGVSLLLLSQGRPLVVELPTNSGKNMTAEFHPPAGETPIK